MTTGRSGRAVSRAVSVVVATALMLCAADLGYAQHYYARDPVAEPESRNDVLPPADDAEPEMVPDELLQYPEAAPAPPPEALAPSNLRIESRDLSEAPGLMPAPKPPAHASTWRTSFGSERKSDGDINSSPATQTTQAPQTTGVDADVVLLQGVSDVAVLRRLFPPRSWRLVVSRRALPGRAAAPSPGLARVTAVAVRAKRGLRITGRDHTLDLQSAEDSGTSGASATAVRVADGPRVIWFVSVMLPEACRAQSVECAPRKKLAEWRQAKRDAGQTTVVGGLYSDATPATPEAGIPKPPCSHQAIESIVTSGTQATGSLAEKREGSGCVALLELPAR